MIMYIVSQIKQKDNTINIIKWVRYIMFWDDKPAYVTKHDNAWHQVIVPSE